MHTHIVNKINHINNKTGKLIENILFIYQPHNYLSDEVYDIEVELSDEVLSPPKRLLKQIEYLNKYLVKYNKKHGTTYNVKIFVWWE
ncbi:MAG: hypothetical protein IKU98_07300 [Bacteroidaceae bacterium]|nr:hypothetical protein [Bacteroidaceae bacterium]